MAGMMQYGLTAGNDAMKGMRYYTSMKRKMDSEKAAMDQADKMHNQQMNMGYGAAAGALAGTVIMPGIGTAIGGLVGMLGGSLFG